MGVLKMSARKRKNERGQAITEYILLLAIITLLATTVLRGLLPALDQGMLSFGARLEQNLKTGRYSASIWAN
jgi:Flp pilus assembly pilin Flp